MPEWNSLCCRLARAPDIGAGYAVLFLLLASAVGGLAAARGYVAVSKVVTNDGGVGLSSS